MSENTTDTIADETPEVTGEHIPAAPAEPKAYVTLVERETFMYGLIKFEKGKRTKVPLSVARYLATRTMSQTLVRGNESSVKEIAIFTVEYPGESPRPAAGAAPVPARRRASAPVA